MESPSCSLLTEGEDTLAAGQLVEKLSSWHDDQDRPEIWKHLDYRLGLHLEAYTVSTPWHRRNTCHRPTRHQTDVRDEYLLHRVFVG